MKITITIFALLVSLVSVEAKALTRQTVRNQQNLTINTAAVTGATAVTTLSPLSPGGSESRKSKAKAACTGDWREPCTEFGSAWCCVGGASTDK